MLEVKNVLPTLDLTFVVLATIILVCALRPTSRLSCSSEHPMTSPHVERLELRRRIVESRLSAVSTYAEIRS